MDRGEAFYYMIQWLTQADIPYSNYINVDGSRVIHISTAYDGEYPPVQIIRLQKQVGEAAREFGLNARTLPDKTGIILYAVERT